LRELLEGNDTQHGALVSDPVLEGAIGYASTDKTLADLSGSLLHPKVFDALTGKEGNEYHFAPTILPYCHQLESWQHLTAEDTRSVLVTSGTGSGKTECFLVPLLNDLAKEVDNATDRLSGVRAIMLYPLNALIASQRERLRCWTAPFQGSIRFGLYNGMTPEDLREHDRKAEAIRHPEEVIDRKTIRTNPPQILVTNVTMLEYLTIRREDRPLVDNSQGKLRWIIIDEAHSYVGSAAAEIALLIRRVLQTFGVQASNVRFVATSATIGSDTDASRATLRRFLADLAGVDEAQVYVVRGTKAKINFPPASERISIDVASLFDRETIGANSAVQAFMRAADTSAVSLATAQRLLSPTGIATTDLLEAIASDKGGPPLLPLRVHQFLRAVPGLWSCLNHLCTGPKPESWCFGALSFERVDQCEYCRCPLFEVQGCHDCGEPYLTAYDDGERLVPMASSVELDEFSAASESEIESDGDDAEADSNEAPRHQVQRRRILGVRPVNGMIGISIELASGLIVEKRDAGITLAVTPMDWDGGCLNCRAGVSKSGESSIRSFRFGAPFLIGNAAPVMLDGVEPMDQRDGLLPSRGRRLLSFTDSRQGTARFAGNIETNSERSYVRGYLYHLAQKSRQVDPERMGDLDAQRRNLEIIEGAAKENPVLAEVARQQRAAFEILIHGSDVGVRWADARLKISQDPMIRHWIRSVWEDRDPRFAKDPELFANFMILRELARRPRRANALETLGLVRLRFERIEKISERDVPHLISTRGRTLQEWKEFLYYLIDASVRSYFALNVSWDDVRWLLPHGGVRRNIVGPGEAKRAKSDRTWPHARPGAAKSNPVILLERVLQLDSGFGEDCSQINDILSTAWDALRPLFDIGGSEYSLDLEKASLSPISKAWLCPVTRRVITYRVFGLTPYGHREASPFSLAPLAEVEFPTLPLSFPRSATEVSQVAQWLRTDDRVGDLRRIGIWRDLHDRAALLAPYLRAEEHSAQQPPARLRTFEDEFKKGKINILACSTTMEMGVDIGSVSAVMMTNVPPSIANYRQRVGRAGRRRQGFASSLTLARDTPLDRETFRSPVDYLKRDLRAPQVKLDASRIVQRHVNALLLAQWFAEAKGELLKIKAGTFFGFPDNLKEAVHENSPVADFCGWLEEPSVRSRLAPSLRSLTQGTALEGEELLCDATAELFRDARTGFERQWCALRSESVEVTSEAARKSVAIQIKRLSRENLLKELSNRALLPGHGFPTSVVPFINDCRETRARQLTEEPNEGAFARRYDYPSRNADIAIREYAPGAEVVVDGLVWRSAGVTLNWQRPAHQEDVHEIQSLKNFWQCASCGAADCSRLRVVRCPSCDSVEIRKRRFLEPAGFRVDWDAPSHADTDKVVFIEPEPARLSVRGAAWEPLLDPALGRGRCSSDGLVFFAAAGAGRKGYRICLDCGRAEEDRGDGSNPLSEHTPLRGARPDGERFCPGGGNPFSVTEPIALGHEIQTDVAEIQPSVLSEIGGAWALASALREALARRLGIQPGELGMAVEPRLSPLAQPTHSIFLFDRSAGGAGFSTRMLDDVAQLLDEARSILDCVVPGCERGCAACIMAVDLFAQQDVVDRKLALNCVLELIKGVRAPKREDVAVPNAKLSPAVADNLVRRMARGDTATIVSREAFDLAVFDKEPFLTLLSTARKKGVEVRLAIRGDVLGALNAAQRLGLRDASLRHHFNLWSSSPVQLENGAELLATLASKGETVGWFTRDAMATTLDSTWGVGISHPIVWGGLVSPPPTEKVGEAALLPKASAAVRMIEQDSGRSLRLFGNFFSNLLKSELTGLDFWRPGDLAALSYSDRYLRSPLTVALTLRALTSLRDALAGKNAVVPLRIVTAPLEERDTRTPYQLSHDWRSATDRADVLKLMAKGMGFDLSFDAGGAAHARQLEIGYRDGRTIRLYLDQGFGYWRASVPGRFDFSASPSHQVKSLEAAAPLVAGRGSTYIAVASTPT